MIQSATFLKSAITIRLPMHAYGGPIAAMDSVEATMNVPVDYYVRVNMKAFIEAVNELGGIYYDVPYDLNEPNTDDTGKIKIKKGTKN